MRASGFYLRRKNSDKQGKRALSIRQPYAALILRGICIQQSCGQQIKPIEEKKKGHPRFFMFFLLAEPR